MIQKKHTIKIPDDITMIYYQNKSLLTIIGSKSRKSIKLKTKLLLRKNPKIIEISCTTTKPISNKEKKKLRSTQGTTTAIIKRAIAETCSTTCAKLKLVGVGFRGFFIENFGTSLLLLKLGFSHFLYFKIQTKINVFCMKFTKLFIFGESYEATIELASFIRSYKKPEPYKGKGILYKNERISLKEGKKV